MRLGNRGIVRRKEKQQTRAALKEINTKQSHNQTRREKGKTKDNTQPSCGERKARKKNRRRASQYDEGRYSQRWNTQNT